MSSDLASRFNLRFAVRQSSDLGDGVFAVGDIDANTNWSRALSGVDAIIHTAARAHIMDKSVGDPLAAYCIVNVQGTLALARQAAVQGVKHFIFISSVKVNGEYTEPGKPFTEDITELPDDPYGLSKYKAEMALRAISKSSGMAVTIIRPPLIYGPGVKGNFAKMLCLLFRGIPLPFGSIVNRRSVLSLGNLSSFVERCLIDKRARAQTFLIADAESVSTARLFSLLGEAIGRKPFMLPVPVWLIQAFARLVGKKEIVARLTESLELDITKAQSLLEWKPPYDTGDEMKRFFG